jgi:hypothetical protein
MGQPFTPSPPAGYTEETEVVGLTNDHSSSANHRTATSPSTENPTMTSSSATRLAVCAAVLKGAAALVPPTCDVGGPYAGNVDDTIAFDGSLSTDPDGTITSYAWDFGDTGTSTDQHPSHQYTIDGIYTVSLMATNSNGNHTLVQPNLILVPEPSGGAALSSGVVALLLLQARRRRARSQAGRRVPNQ